MNNATLEQQGLSNLVEAATALATFSLCSRAPVISPDQSKHTYNDSFVSASNSPTSSGHETHYSNHKNNSKAVEAIKETFPQRLLAILNDSAVSTDVISWLPNGESFVIIRPDIFMESILPKFIAPDSTRSAPVASTTVSTKYPSFTRKLNRWGFRQITRGPETGAFYQELFRRDQPELCLQMFCLRSKGGSPHTKKAPKETTRRKHNTTINVPLKKRRVSLLTKESLDVMNQEQAISTGLDTNLPTIAAIDKPVTISEDSQSMRSSVSDGDGGKSPSIVTPTIQKLSGSLLNGGCGITTNPVLVHRAINKRNEEERMRLAKVMLYNSFLQAMNGEER